MLVDFDAVMTSATVVLNGVTVSTHQGVYLPWSAELTGHLAAGRNVLAVIVDARLLDVPPDNPPGGTGYTDYLQPGGIYRRQTTGAVTFHSTTGWAEDLYSYDDYSSTAGNAILKPPVTGVPYFVSESVGALDGAPLYRRTDPAPVLAEQGRMHAQVHNIAQSDARYAGLLAWCGIDYASISGGNRIWNNLKTPGVTDTFRVPKPGAAFYRSQVPPDAHPVILPMFFWDFGAGSPAAGPGPGSIIATNCHRLEIYVGGEHFTTAFPDTHDYGSLAYPLVFADLTVDGATRLTFRALDAYGNQRPYVTGDVALSLAGPATLISQNPFAFGTYGGVGGAFVRSEPGRAGLVTVTAERATLGHASARLTVTPAAGQFL